MLFQHIQKAAQITDSGIHSFFFLSDFRDKSLDLFLTSATTLASVRPQAKLALVINNLPFTTVVLDVSPGWNCTSNWPAGPAEHRP
jgi:hypothetical protein